MQLPNARILGALLVFELSGARFAGAAESASKPSDTNPSSTPDSEPSTTSDSEPPPATPSSAPPPVIPAAPGWNDHPAAEADDATATPKARGSVGEFAVGTQWFWASGKAMPGVALRGGQGIWWIDLEASLIHLTRPSSDLDVRFLGNQFGIFAMVRAKLVKRLELAAGAGADVYGLWNIHGDEWQAALALRATAHVALASHIGIFGTARGYPLSTSGLELGTYRDGSRGLPVLFSTGLEWRFQ